MSHLAGWGEALLVDMYIYSSPASCLRVPREQRPETTQQIKQDVN